MNANEKKIMKDLYGAAEMSWRNRLHGTEAVRILKEAAKMTGEKYEPSKTEIESDPNYHYE